MTECLAKITTACTIKHHENCDGTVLCLYVQHQWRHQCHCWCHEYDSPFWQRKVEQSLTGQEA